MLPEPFQDSRRLTGCNPYFAGTGAALESAGAMPDPAAVQRWRVAVQAMRDALGWPDGPLHARLHASGAVLAFAAPFDQLYTATELNEWAWWRALLDPSSSQGRREQPGLAFDLPHAPGHPALWDVELAAHTLQAGARAEARPELRALQAAADARGLPFLLDEDELSLGLGAGGRSWFLDDLPVPGQVPWPLLHTIPTALVTGSNGKTTVVRLLAALCRAHGWRTAHCCTDGVFMDGREIEAGDFSGPAGAREALRQGDARAAVLETARGGLLRRGLALCRAEVAVVTNISADHFGEYGVHDLDDLAAVKLTVARAIGPCGRLVLNADDPVLLRHAPTLDCPLAGFALDFDAPALAAMRAAGQPTCGVRAGRLLLAGA
ncbi:MAG: Mur ligase family protein, partial [Pseudoxanthomonas sp.]